MRKLVEGKFLLVCSAASRKSIQTLTTQKRSKCRRKNKTRLEGRSAYWQAHETLRNGVVIQFHRQAVLNSHRRAMMRRSPQFLPLFHSWSIICIYALISYIFRHQLDFEILERWTCWAAHFFAMLHKFLNKLLKVNGCWALSVGMPSEMNSDGARWDDYGQWIHIEWGNERCRGMLRTVPTSRINSLTRNSDRRFTYG